MSVVRRIVLALATASAAVIAYGVFQFVMPRNTAELERLQNEAGNLRVGASVEQVEEELRRLGLKVGPLQRADARTTFVQSTSGPITAEVGESYLFAQKDNVAYTVACGHDVWVWVFFKDGKLTRAKPYDHRFCM